MIAAIYSRKSIFTGKGESIGNQIELCKEYGNRLNITNYLLYEDEGFSGGNIHRPRFQDLLKDAKDKKFDVLICYRLDRISRNVADFSSTLEMLQNHNIDFISIKEQFDTSTPMGRAMVYISSVFAQLERETIAERVRDNMLQLAKTGRWLGGQEPFGYSAEKVTYIDAELKERSLMKLIPIDEELEIVKLIFNKYLEKQSLTQVAKYLILANIKGKNGGEWSTTQVKRMLTNPLYVKSSMQVDSYLTGLGINVFGEANGNGYLTYNKTKSIVQHREITEWIAAIGKQPGVIEASLWLETQNVMDSNKDKSLSRLGTSDTTSILSGLLKCKSCGAAMKIKQGHISSQKVGTRHDYYVCSLKDASYGTKCNNINIRVDRLDKLVIEKVKAYSKELLIEELTSAINNENHPNVLPNQIEEFREKIKVKEKEISNLVKELRKDSDEITNEYIHKDIKELHDQVSKLKININQLETNNTILYENIDNAQIVLDALNRFNNEFDILEDVHQKRNMLKTIIEYITWTGQNSKFTVHLFIGDKK